MKQPARGILVAVVILCLAVGGYWFYRERQAPGAKPAGPDAQQSVPVASVSVVTLGMTELGSDITVYGDVVPAPGAIQVVSVPYESRVRRVMVSARQKISRGDDLLEIEPSPNALLELEQAQNGRDIARQKLAHVKELFALKLATNAQILGAEEAAGQASARLESLKKRGVDGKRLIRSEVTGLIGKVHIQEGAIVPAGNPLAEIIAQDRLEVRLGVEPGDVNRLVPGQPVRLSDVNVSGAQKTIGRIRKISRAVNPATRLVDVFVTLPGSAKYLLGEYVLGRLRTASSHGLVVPRRAVLPEGGNHVLYTVRNGHAVKHIVQIGIESGNRVEVSGGGLKPGDEAVVLGNYELEDGMPVKVQRTE
jgi:membrane fusion protein (multidrug efflux system)